MTWQIEIPHASRDERLVDVASRCRHLTGEQADVSRALVLGAVYDGDRTAGELLDRLDAMAPPIRRALLDRARTEAGLPTTGKVESEARWEARQAENQRGLMLGIGRCHADGCDQIATMPDGSLRRVDEVRWHCPAHRHLAQPGDLDPQPLGARIAPSGAIVEDDPVAEAKAAAQVESLRNRREAEAVAAAAEGAELAEREQADRERVWAELPPSVRGAA